MGANINYRLPIISDPAYLNRRLVQLRLDVPDAEPRDDLHVGRQVAVRVLVVLEGLRVVVLARVDVAEAREHLGVGRHRAESGQKRNWIQFRDWLDEGRNLKPRFFTVTERWRVQYDA